MSIPPIISPQLDNEIQRIFHNEGFYEIEIKLNYFFQNKAYLISAFTHSSKSKHCIINSYERYYTIKKTRFLFCIFAYFRLEFLGDALLDLLVIRHTFLNYDRNITPGNIANYPFFISTNENRLGRVTDIRQDLSNNNQLAHILVSSDLHNKIRHNSNQISNQIKSYINNRNSSNKVL